MATRIQDRVADGFASVDEAAENAVEGNRERIWQLLTDPAQRDLELWTAIFADAGVPVANVAKSVKALQNIPVSQRTLGWNTALSAMATAAQRQTRLEMARDIIIEKAARHAAKVNDTVRSSGRKLALVAAQEGIGSVDFNAAKERRRQVF